MHISPSTNKVNYDLSQISHVDSKNLNTFRVSAGSDPYGDISKYCEHTISGKELDEKTDIYFSDEKRKEAWGENYKDIILSVKKLDGSTRIVVIPGVEIGGMGTNVSGKLLVEESFKLGIGCHLSSVGIGGSYKQPSMYEKDRKTYDEIYNQVEKNFYNLFEINLGLPKQLIEKEFFAGEEGLDEEFSLSTTDKNARLLRMKDAIAIYDTVKEMKNKGINFGINCMYKTSGYTMAIKVATLAGVDRLTTSAGFPNINPKNIIINFLSKANQHLKKPILNIPAMGLIVSMYLPNETMIETMAGYDYYVIEDGNPAGGHLGIREPFFDNKRSFKYEVLKKFKDNDKFKDSKFILGGGYNSKESIKEAFDKGADGVQFGTLAAVSQEAVNGKGEEFKKALISGNHLGERSEIDEISQEHYIKGKQGIKNLIKQTQNKLFGILNGTECQTQTEKVLLFINITLFPFLYKGENKPELDEEEQKIYNKLINSFFDHAYSRLYRKFIKDSELAEYDHNALLERIIEQITDLNPNKKLKYDRTVILTKILKKLKNSPHMFQPKNTDAETDKKLLYRLVRTDKNIANELIRELIMIEIQEILQSYGNALKFIRQFEKFEKENPGKHPTHLVLDSVIGHNCRKRIDKDDYRLLMRNETIRCVKCITRCLLMKRGGVKKSEGSEFCIILGLDQELRDSIDVLKINFSGTTTVPYDEIRPIKDTIAFLMGTYVKR